MSSVNTSSLPKEEKIANKPLILVFEVIMPSLFLLHYFYSLPSVASKKYAYILDKINFFSQGLFGHQRPTVMLINPV